MKPCSNNRKLIGLLAVDALSANEQRELCAHIQTCDGCRAYLQEISNVAQKLATVQTRSQIQSRQGRAAMSTSPGRSSTSFGERCRTGA